MYKYGYDKQFEVLMLYVLKIKHFTLVQLQAAQIRWKMGSEHIGIKNKKGTEVTNKSFRCSNGKIKTGF